MLTSGIVGNIARAKNQTGGLPVEIGHFLLKSEMGSAIAGNVPGPPCTGTIRRQ
jgi:hypothetical protein